MSSSVLADELRIIDSHGLTRAVAVVEGKADVEVSLSQETNELKLINPDGLAEELTASKLSGTKYMFHSVVQGNWQLKSPVQVQAVKIVGTK